MGKGIAGLLVAAVVCLAPAAALAGEEAGHKEAAPARLIAPMGIVTFTFVAATFLTGWFMPKKRKLLFKWHRVLAIIALACALLHGGLVIFLD
ncbi:MAG: hypothetical protein AMJ81_06035 [Phycisphaerae bacterium SM23_33]|nr:MAG: hypothetical protein AMJ81_06035 [Phycisphaerae bacterium SM23_33]